MNQLDYQTVQSPFHPGPAAQFQQAYAIQGQRFPTNTSTPLQPNGLQAFAPAPYPRPPHSAPGFQDGGLVQPTFAGHQQTTAPYPHSIAATAGNTPTPPRQLPQQHQQQPSRAVSHSASPQLGNSPYVGNQTQHQQQPPNQHTPPGGQKYPMAAPPLPQSVSSPQSPQSPGSQARDQKRLDLILDINLQLLQEISNLQSQGHGGATSPAVQQQMKAQGMSDQMASEDFIQCMRRVQANLAYLAQRADPSQTQGKPIPGPAHMTPPSHMPQLQQPYEQLRELLPGWSGFDNKYPPAHAGMSPRANSMNGMHTPQAAPQSAQAH